MGGLASLMAKSLRREASKAITKDVPETAETGASKSVPKQLEMPLKASEEVPVGLDQRSLKDQYQESLDKLGDATSIAPTPPRMFGDPKYPFLNPILEQTGRKAEDVIAEGVGEYSDVAGKRFITNKRVSNSQINPYNGPGPKFKGTLSEDDITEEQIKNLAKQLRSEDVGLLKTNLLKKDKFTVVDDKTGGQLDSIGKEGDSYGIVTVAVSGVKNAPQYKKNRGMESDHIYGLHLNIEGDAALLTHKVKDVRASAKKGKEVYQQPSLKPTMVGDMRGRNIIGTIKVAGRKEHPLYDVIDVDAATFSDYGFNQGGLLNNNVVEFDASIFEDDTINMNEGGAVMPMEKQMELFEDGGEVDPVSGNGIPLGSTAKEVRDDQPAMLSEGEMVVPADVVRYFGVEFFMDLRDKAKIGYKKMEAMGQFGTEEGQTLPDDTLFNAGGPPFTIEDIEVIEDYEEEEEEPTEKKSIKAADGALIDDNAVVTDDDLTNTGNKVAFNLQNVQDLIGTNAFEYLKKFMPASVTEQASEEQQGALQNYANNLIANMVGGDSGSSTRGGSTVSSGGLDPETHVNTPGYGSVSQLMAAPTYENIQGLKSFASLADSYVGRAMLSGMGQLVSRAINPIGSVPIGGLVQGLAGMMERGMLGTNTIATSLQSLSDIPMVQANAANRAAISYENSFKDLDKEDRDMVQVVAALDSFNNMQGVDVMDDPNYSVSIDKDGNIHASHIGPLAANYTYSPHFGWQHTVAPKGLTAVPKSTLKDINQVIDQAKKDAALAASLTGSLRSEQEQKALGLGLTGPETDLSITGVPTISRALGYNPEDIPDETSAPNTGTGPDGGTNEGVEGSKSGISTPTMDAAEDVDPGMQDSNDSGGGGGTSGSDGGSTGSASDGYMARGGLIKRRNTRKKKKRRCLAGR